MTDDATDDQLGIGPGPLEALTGPVVESAAALVPGWAGTLLQTIIGRVRGGAERDPSTFLEIARARSGQTPNDFAATIAEDALFQEALFDGLQTVIWTGQEMCDLWADEFDAKVATRRPRIDPGLAREGMALFRSLPASAARSVLLCTDLHAGNVLAAARAPWLMIDPKP